MNKIKSLRILIFNWRDIKNPSSGGSEVFIHNVAKIWANLGHHVTIFTSYFIGSKGYENIDGIKIFRAGNSFTIRLYAFIFYLRLFKGNFDIVIEVKNGGFPWFCRLYVKEPLCVLAHQVGRDFREFDPKNSTWFYELCFPLYHFAYLIEPLCLKTYKGLHILVVSKSTGQSFFDLGFSNENIHYVPEGGMPLNNNILNPIEEIGSKTDLPTFIYLGRIKPSKRIDHVLKAIALVKLKYPEIFLWIVGSGNTDYKDKLDDLIESLEIKDNIKFFGYVSDNYKKELLRTSHALLITSIREGWGLVVTEANVLGTPAIGYNVSGLRDSIKDGKTGLLCKNGDITSLAKNIINFIENKEMQANLTRNAWNYSKMFNWNKSANIFLNHLYNILE